MIPLDLNCDLAEGEPAEHTSALMAHITSANIACAGHAGTEATMRHAIDLGKSLGVRLGAHPGLPGHFGRASAAGLTPAGFRALLDDQVGRFLMLAEAAGAAMRHVKLHGALYHATETSPVLRDAYIAFMNARAPHATIFALAGGHTAAAARAAGLTAWDEVFADRAYLPDASLVPRSEPGAVIGDPAAVADRVAGLARGQPITAIDGTPLVLHPRTLCIHSDSPLSLALAQAARDTLDSFL